MFASTLRPSKSTLVVRRALVVLLGLAVVMPSPTFSNGESLRIASIPNLRDLGGYVSATGAIIATGRLYRSDQLKPVNTEDMIKFSALGLKTILDLRTADERDARPDQIPEGVTNVWLNVLADADQSGPARLEKLLHDPQQANIALGNGKAEQLFEKGYRDFVSLPSARDAYRHFFLTLAEPVNLPVLFHCTTGKDRTGWSTGIFADNDVLQRKCDTDGIN